jgi:hypothetical protein
MANTLEQAEVAFERGDYRTARAIYSALYAQATSGLEPEIPEHLDRRLKALSLDRFALALGLGSLGIIFTSYVLALALA